jgi:hypothetical protein
MRSIRTTPPKRQLFKKYDSAVNILNRNTYRKVIMINMKLNLPNRLTVLRLILIPFCMAVIIFPFFAGDVI